MAKKKLTKKERILRFVEQKGSARFTDIQRFIVDEACGKGTYDNAKREELVWIYDKNPPNYGHRVNRLLNTYRGTYCYAFNSYSGHLMLGKDYLEKRDKLYYVVRNGVHKPYPKRFRPSAKYYDEFRKDFKDQEDVIEKTPVETPTTKNIESEIPEAVENIEVKIEELPECDNFNQQKISDLIPGYKATYQILSGCGLGSRKEFSSDYIALAQKITHNEDSKESVDLPKFCRWCGHSLDPMHFEKDDKEMLPSFCTWCSHKL